MGQEEKGTTEDEMAGWHHWLDGRDSEWTPGVGDGQGGLVCCDSRGPKESDTTERLNWTELILFYTAFLGVSKQGRRVPSQPHFQNGYLLLFKFKASYEVDNEKWIIFKFNLQNPEENQVLFNKYLKGVLKGCMD